MTLYAFTCAVVVVGRRHLEPRPHRGRVGVGDDRGRDRVHVEAAAVARGHHPHGRADDPQRRVADRLLAGGVGRRDPVVEGLRVQLDRESRPGGTKRRADRRTSGSIGTPAAVEGHLHRVRDDPQRQRAGPLRRRARSPGAAAARACRTIFSGRRRMSARRAAGSTPKPAAPRHHGDVGVAHLDGRGPRVVVDPVRDPVGEGIDPRGAERRRSGGTSRVGARPTVARTPPAEARAARARRSRRAAMPGGRPSSRRAIAIRNAGSSVRVITRGIARSSRARFRATTAMPAASLPLTSTPATFTDAGARPRSSPPRATAAPRPAPTSTTSRRHDDEGLAHDAPPAARRRGTVPPSSRAAVAVGSSARSVSHSRTILVRIAAGADRPGHPVSIRDGGHGGSPVDRRL